MIYLVTVIKPDDADYLCQYTVLADTASDAMAFAELHNPGLIATDAIGV